MEGRKRLVKDADESTPSGFVYQTQGLPGSGVVRIYLPCLRGETGCGKIIKFLAHIEICYVFSIGVSKEM